MKVIEVQEHYDSAVSGHADITFDVDSAEIAELEKALAVVSKYEKAALEALKESGADPTESDWHRFSFAVESERAVITITDGMAG